MKTLKSSSLIKTALLILFCLGGSFHGQSQDFSKVLDQMREGYAADTRVHIVMIIKAFDSPESPKPLYNETAEIKKDGENYLYNFGSNQMLMNQNYFVVIDEKNRQINLSHRKKRANPQGKFNMNLDSILNFYETPTFLESKAGTDHYQLIQKTGDIKSVDFFVDSQSDILKKMAYYYQKGQYVEIIFQVFDKNPSFDALAFDEKKYLTITKNKKIPSPAYQQYQIVDLGQEYEQ